MNTRNKTQKDGWMLPTKWWVLLGFFALTFASSHAQILSPGERFSRFKLRIIPPFLHAGVEVPASDNEEDGRSYVNLLGISPQVYITDYVSVGWQSQAWVRLGQEESQRNIDNIRAGHQIVVDGYFSKRLIRPSVGAGIGIHTISSYDTYLKDTRGYFVVSPRVGLDIIPSASPNWANKGLFQFHLGYHISFESALPNIFHVGISWSFGGGRLPYQTPPSSTN